MRSPYVVVSEQSLCYTRQMTNSRINLLASKGAGGHNPMTAAINISKGDVLRNATAQDFKDFRIQVPSDFDTDKQSTHPLLETL